MLQTQNMLFLANPLKTTQKGKHKICVFNVLDSWREMRGNLDKQHSVLYEQILQIFVPWTLIKECVRKTKESALLFAPCQQLNAAALSFPSLCCRQWRQHRCLQEQQNFAMWKWGMGSSSSAQLSLSLHIAELSASITHSVRSKRRKKSKTFSFSFKVYQETSKNIWMYFEAAKLQLCVFIEGENGGRRGSAQLLSAYIG